MEWGGFSMIRAKNTPGETFPEGNPAQAWSAMQEEVP